ncbi:hypothetical protein PAECIP111893_04487 [Paenibacillus plantiphilus]|uniref:Uncharacterized protein n=1 Tax=Paenibacillus plantiphilus TaxID=2905650 RepID=A0ABM9CMS1_9BACL|nr:hypothetical protein [Paenibacillus plantiphilus]CAH1218806.1 hypothetical protein PAECIP111893_04487 [Paenibacillus plantiphilus]
MNYVFLAFISTLSISMILFILLALILDNGHGGDNLALFTIGIVISVQASFIIALLVTRKQR